ncbi:hypothetical protein COU77_00020 [Candidatus Peregrinibacteria bacterium CG10_big_fil_rev_8_21_14_0_10_49_16]|nr:MAG: hypothetical protein COW95_04240 [Candidatus Peregrinibacteria bacterium CG22_combo_CG10-13_8_21_14_all_49_11]PIR52486.1 MAG: hypothetical protein COU77_00020 [Candidatus Peregrinibacteria bacterium CG10_big_fil_rev_8_21_14_0_10_49_16]
MAEVDPLQKRFQERIDEVRAQAESFDSMKKTLEMYKQLSEKAFGKHDVGAREEVTRILGDSVEISSGNTQLTSEGVTGEMSTRSSGYVEDAWNDSRTEGARDPDKNKDSY